ncbi:MAG: transporter substrate-binding domain-containing protein [Alphaproteobacteria bacterium]|nr:transporter substrate-binding domain-containing protein [Alphaproteobacteria bacterium]
MPGFTLKACIFTLILTLSAGQTGRADDTLRFYFLPLPGLLGEDGKSGSLGKAIAEIGNRSGIRFQLVHSNQNRLIRELKGDAPAAGAPQLGAMVAERFGQNMRLSVPLVFRWDFVFVRSGQTIPHAIEDIRKKILVVSPMTTLPPPLNDIRETLTVLETHSDASALLLLSKGRADIWINDETTTMAAKEEAGVSNIHYDAEQPFYVWPAHIVYSAQVEATVINRIDEAILSMVRDDSLKDLMPQNFASRYERYLSGGSPHESAFP